jgi:hypothetical protein
MRGCLLGGQHSHVYADDTQLYVHCKLSGMIDAVARLGQCIDRVDKWMSAMQSAEAGLRQV